MTRIEQRALEVYPVIMETLIPVSTDHEEVNQDCNQFIRNAYQKGAEWGCNDMLERILQWLEVNVDFEHDYPASKLELINDLRESMTHQSCSP